jgi:O-Antigen ligase
LYIILGLFNLVSVFIYFVFPQLAYDPDSGRFSGALISVAVACNVFSLFAVLAFYAYQVGQTSKARIWHGSMVLLGFTLLYLSKTRSSLLEALFAIFLLWVGGRVAAKAAQRNVLRNVMIPVLVLLAGATFIVAFSLGGIDKTAQLNDFRLSETSLLDARGGNWEFGIERVLAAPVFGEGLLTKQTQGGTASLNLEEGKNYNPIYDPHNLILSFAVQGGIPFAFAMIALIVGSLGYFLRAFGWRQALRSPEFVICAVRTLIMVPAGGDLTSFGNSIDRIYWMLLGVVVIKAFAKNSAYKSQIKVFSHARTKPRNLFA